MLFYWGNAGEMPPGTVKTAKDLIFWKYAKLIAGSAGFGKNNQLATMELSPSIS